MSTRPLSPKKRVSSRQLPAQGPLGGADEETNDIQVVRLFADCLLQGMEAVEETAYV